MDLDIVTSFLPEFLLDHFTIVGFKKLGNVRTKQMEFEIHLDERNRIEKDVDCSVYESKGFLPSSRIQDFPIRGKAV